MDVVGEFFHFLIEHGERTGDILPVLAIHGAGFGLEHPFFVMEVLEPIAFKLDDPFEIFGGKIVVIRRDVIRGIGISAGPDTGHDAVAHRARVFLGPSEHHMFEKRGKAGFTWLHFVPASGPDNRIVRDKPGAFHRDHNDLQTVGKCFDGIGVRKDRSGHNETPPTKQKCE